MQKYKELKCTLNKNKSTEVKTSKNGIYKIISLNNLSANTSLA